MRRVRATRPLRSRLGADLLLLEDVVLDAVLGLGDARRGDHPFARAQPFRCGGCVGQNEVNGDSGQDGQEADEQETEAHGSMAVKARERDIRAHM
jgi:hypothetical protein